MWDCAVKDHIGSIIQEPVFVQPIKGNYIMQFIIVVIYRCIVIAL